MLFVIEMPFICGKGFGKFAVLLSNISLHLVEVSPTLSDIQDRTLAAGSHKDKKNEKQCGATRSTAFGNEVLSAAACKYQTSPDSSKKYTYLSELKLEQKGGQLHLTQLCGKT